MSTKSAIEIANHVNLNMPSIGFMSRAKRIQAFNIACATIEELAKDEDGEVDMEKAFEAAAMLTHMNKKFHKASFMVVLNFDRIPIGHLSELAYQFALIMRQKNM